MPNTGTINSSVVNGSTEQQVFDFMLSAGAGNPVVIADAVHTMSSLAANSYWSAVIEIRPLLASNAFQPMITYYYPTPTVMSAMTAVAPAIITQLEVLGLESVGADGLLTRLGGQVYGAASAAMESQTLANYVRELLIAADSNDVTKVAGVKAIIDVLYALDDGLVPEVVAIEDVYLLSQVVGISRSDTEAVLEVIRSGGVLRSELMSDVVDALAVRLQPQGTLTVFAEAQISVDTDDIVDTQAYYSQRLGLFAGAFVSFRLSGDLVQGWVMNMEGDRPISEYRGFDFNSFAVVNGVYYAAGDQGLYVMGDSDTDDGQPIDASLRTMMLDFDTTKQKRVVAAYLGYTASGELLLKIRSVDDGVLVEQWYEATGTQADAPQEGYRQLGRGMKSRYWQFELVNVDGADFEVDKLEVLPIQLSRRV